MSGRKHKSPINRSILIGCGALIVVLSLLLSLQTRGAFTNALYEQYDARLRDVVTAVEGCADADDLRVCIQNTSSSPKRDELQQIINRFVDDFELGFLYIVIPVDTPDGGMLSVISSTSAEERLAGDDEDWPILYDCSDEYTREQIQPYLDAWNAEGVSIFEEDSDYGLCYTGCKPLVTSDGETIALICADYYVDEVQSTVSGYVARSVALIVAVCAFFGSLLALWLRRNVTKPIRVLEQSALRFAKMAHEDQDASKLSLDADGLEASSEVKLLIDAMTALSEEMKDQAASAVVVKNYAREMEAENQRLSEKAAAAIKIAELTQSVTALLTNMPGMTSSKDVNTGEYLACNQTFAEFANKRSPEEVIGLTDAEIFSEATAAKFAADDKKALSMDQPYNFYEQVTDAAGNSRQFQTTKLKFTDTTGRLCTLCMRLDYTELMRVKQETAEAQRAYEEAQSASATYSSIAHTLSAGYIRLYYVDLDTGAYIAYKSGGEDAEAEERGEDFFAERKPLILQRIHPADRDVVGKAFTRKNILKALGEHAAFKLTYRRERADGEYAYASLQAIQMQDDARHVMIGIGENADVDARNELTGLRMEPAYDVRGRELLLAHPEGWCVIAIDLEHFRLFNEWYGREAGDQLLAQIGERLSAVEAAIGGLACYLGQDDFALVAPYDEEKIKTLFGSIHKFLVERGTSVGFMPAFGVCMADAETPVEELLDRAVQASHHAKEDYHNRIRVFEESMYQKTERDYQILSDFQQALKDRELFINLQPQCETAGGKIVGAESLVRWKKADGTMVSPGVFVPVLEQYGFVTDLDQFVWEEVCRWQREWIDGGHTPLPVSVNVSQIDIFTIDVPDYLDRLLEKYSLPVETVKVEITESAYVGSGAAADTVRRLRERGFLVLMDDFGSGYSSLNMLRTLNVDVIKLDAQFLRMDAGDAKGVHILESIVSMAKSMEAPIIVEGVETQEEMDFVNELGCRYVQGYFFYRPMPVADFETLIADEGRIDTSGFRL